VTRRSRRSAPATSTRWLLAGLALLAGGPAVCSVPTGAAASGPVAAAPPAPLEPELLEIGALARERGLPEARARLAAFAATGASRAALARTLEGLLAHGHDDPALALDRLEAEAAPAALEDWRLYVLADSAAALRRTERARAALLELLERHPDSPLRAQALVRLAELAWSAGDEPAAWARVEQGRSERLPRERAVALEKVAWQMAGARGDAARLREAARRLLVVDPLEASRMQVVESVSRHGGGSDWRLWLDADELLARSDALLAAELPAGALTTLAAVPAAARQLEWRLLEARALTASGRAADAHAALRDALAPDATGRAALAWQRALAAGAAASPAGRRTDAAAVATWRRLEREHLLEVARSEAAPQLARRALRRLAASYFEAGREPEALAAWRQLVQLEPADSAGAKPIWQRGWEAYAAGDARRAVALWAELGALYPDDPQARAGRYWTARALERLGDAAGARAAYRSITAVAVSDFYARQAGLRLAGDAAPPIAAPAPEPWPEDASLARARLLTDLGLDGLARAELELVAPGAEPRATAALTALVAAREGDTRGSLRQLRRAFPALGTALQASAPAAALELYYPLDFRAAIARAAAEQGLPAALVFGMVHQESGFDPAAHSRSGARGLMQLMPGTGREMAKKLGLPYSAGRLQDPEYSLRLGTGYFRRVLAMFDGNQELALAAYNGGPGRISRLWRAAGPTPELDRFLEGLTLEESRNYVKRIVVLAASYRSLYPDLG
jgi:soluble lytic murein transglycosylase